MNNPSDILKIGIGQIAPKWLNRDETLEKVLHYVRAAAKENCQLVCFGEALLPGYPFWLELSDGARFNSTVQKEIHAHYMDQAVQVESNHLSSLRELAAQLRIAVILGIVERAADRGGHSLYCSLVYMDQSGAIQSVHRKLVPTYEERLTWAPGDGHGLKVHSLGRFTIGALNCWENWMPLPRASLYAQGEDCHVAIWPGNLHNTEDITRFIAKESRSYVISASSLMRKEDFPKSTPYLDNILSNCSESLANGGSCVANPDGTWLVEPCINEEKLLVAQIDHKQVRRERQNFDPVGHYSRPDVTQLVIHRSRQSTLSIKD